MEGGGQNKSPLGKSRLVPSVQHLVSKTPGVEIPPRYLLPEALDESPAAGASPQQVPVIDMGALLSGDASHLHSACRDWGFFQVVNHGVSASLIETFKAGVKQLFNLPIEEKKKYWQTEDNMEGFGQAFVVSDDQKLDWADLFLLTTLPKALRKPHLLPMLPLPFRETLEEYSIEVKRVAIELMEHMGRALGMELEGEGYMRDLFQDGTQFVRMNYYPPCPLPHKVIGLSPHSDSVALTILLQVNEMEGLQIKKDGKWIPISPLPGAFVVNLGDVLEIVSNGEYQSIEHRAVVNASKERLSVATFHSLGMDQVVGPAPCLIKPGKPARFRRIKMGEYIQGKFAHGLHGKSYLELMRIR